MVKMHKTDAISRIFHQNIKDLMNFIVKHQIFGET